MMRPSFNVSQKPCVPVNCDEALEEVSLRDALVHAHDLSSIEHPMPTVEFGLYRLLIALVGDIFFVEPGEPLNTSRLGKLLQQGHFNKARVDDYFSVYADRFDLFDEEHPFLQVGGMQDKEKSVAGLLPPLPSGTNVNHFHHANEDDFAVSPEAALGLLATIAPFMTAGGPGLSPSINGAPPIYALIRGTSLFETLCLNLCAVPLALAQANDVPIWRSKRRLGGEPPSSGYLESLSWMPRRIQLTPSIGGYCTLTGRTSDLLIRTMQFLSGNSTRFDWRDPNAAYRLNEKGATILRMREERELWRDTAPLALLTEKSKTAQRPRVVDQFAELKQTNVLSNGKALILELFGIRTDLKMKFFEWQRERLNLPTELVLGSSAEAGFGLEAQSWIDKAEAVARQLRFAIKRVYPRDGKGNKQAFGSRITYSERRYWEALRPTFEELLYQLANLETNTAAHRQPLREAWRKAVERTARKHFEQATEGLDSSAHALERITKARRSLEVGMKRVFDPPPPKDKRAAKKGVKQA